MTNAGSREIGTSTLYLFPYDIHFYGGSVLYITFPLPLADMILLALSADADAALKSCPRIAAWAELTGDDARYILNAIKTTLLCVAPGTLWYGAQALALHSIRLAIPRTSAGTGSSTAYRVLGTYRADEDSPFVGAVIKTVAANSPEEFFIPIPGPTHGKIPATHVLENLVDIQGVLLNTAGLAHWAVLDNLPNAFVAAQASFWTKEP